MHMSKSQSSSKWLLIPFLLVLHLCCSMYASENVGLTKESRSQLQTTLNEQFLRSILVKSNGSLPHGNKNDSVDDFARNLNSFQNELVRKRNAECLFEKHQRFEWSTIKFENFNRSIIEKWTSLNNRKLNLVGNDNLTNLILYELNNKVHFGISAFKVEFNSQNVN